jgi:cell division protein FtsB
MKKRSKTHVPKSRVEQEVFIQAIRDEKESPTISTPSVGEGTLEMRGVDVSPVPVQKPRKSPLNRMSLYLKEKWPSYIITIVISIIGFFAFTARENITKLNKDIEFQSKNLDTATEKIEELSLEVTTVHSEVKSLNDRFQLFIDIFARRNNESP